MPEEMDVAQVKLDVPDPSSEPAQGDVYPKGEPEKPAKEELTEKEKALIKARDEKAQKAREAEEKARRLEEELWYLKNQPKAEEDEEEDLETVLTLADLKRHEQRKKEKEQKEAQARYETNLQKKIYESAVKAKDKYKDSEWTYEWAFQYANEHFPQEDIQAIYYMTDPAQKLYDLVMLQPENRDKIDHSKKQEIVKDTIDTIKKNLSSPGTLTNSGGANSSMDFIKQMDKLSMADFVKAADSVIKQKK